MAFPNYANRTFAGFGTRNMVSRSNELGEKAARLRVATLYEAAVIQMISSQLVASSIPINIFEVAELFKSEQAATEATLQQLGSGGATSARRRPY